MELPIPIQMMYAGLAGTLLALLVAAATNGWSCRVFFLLALRLAIGWHFLFEGLHKINSHMVGPTETSKPFSSEPYFTAAAGPLGPMMREFAGLNIEEQNRRMLAAEYKEFLDYSPEDIDRMAVEELAEVCPPAAQELLGKDVEDEELKKQMFAEYARWVYGFSKREADVEYVEGKVELSGPERLQIRQLLQNEQDEILQRTRLGLGNGNGMELKRLGTVQADLRKFDTQLAADIMAFINELRKEAGLELIGSQPKPIETLDKITMYAITAIGAGLLLGLFTPLWCVLGIGFLVMTYLAHPTVPWLPLPPQTEGNPLFINKNVIEALGLAVIATFPTGRWLGLDSLLIYFCCPPKSSKS